MSRRNTKYGYVYKHILRIEMSKKLQTNNPNRGYWGYQELSANDTKAVSGGDGCGGCGCGCGCGCGSDASSDSDSVAGIVSCVVNGNCGSDSSGQAPTATVGIRG